jgi:hypothetical protein
MISSKGAILLILCLSAALVNAQNQNVSIVIAPLACQLHIRTHNTKI